MGALRQSYVNLVDGDEDAFNGYQALARNIWARYQGKILGGPSGKRVGLPPLKDMQAEILRYLLDPEGGIQPEAKAVLQSQLGITGPPDSATNAPPPAPQTPPAPPRG